MGLGWDSRQDGELREGDEVGARENDKRLTQVSRMGKSRHCKDKGTDLQSKGSRTYRPRDLKVKDEYLSETEGKGVDFISEQFTLSF